MREALKSDGIYPSCLIVSKYTQESGSVPN